MIRKLFQFSLNLNGKVCGMSDLREVTDEIVASKDEFNKRNKDKGVMITAIYEDFIVLLLNMGVSNDSETISHRNVQGLASLIYEKCGLEKRSLKVQGIVQVNKDLCKSIIDTMIFYESSIYNEKDAKRLMVGVSGMDANDETDTEEESPVETFEIEGGDSHSVKQPGGAKSNKSEGGSEPPGGSFKEIETELDSLVGLGEVKSQIKQIIKYIKTMTEKNKALGITSSFPCSILITGNPGSGRNTLVEILYKMLHQINPVKFKTLVKIEGRDLSNWKAIEYNTRNADCGVVHLDGLDILMSSEGDKNSRSENPFESLSAEIEKYSDKFLFLASGRPSCVNKFMGAGRMENHIKFKVEIPDFSIDELMDYGKRLAESRHYSLNEEAEGAMRNTLNVLNGIGKLENLSTVRRIVDDAIIRNFVKADIDNSFVEEHTALTREDFDMDIEPIKKKESHEDKNNPFNDLDLMIGLEKVKSRVREIAAYARAQVKKKELGLTGEPLCLHMALTGRPGTGKTTVARILSKIFHSMGILETGKLIETSREGLVAAYIGQTALKTADKVRQAMGGCLLIDEAYSLFSDSDRDYGNEAVATLIKRMEDDRGKFVVMFAGYPDEMAKFIGMNPGLRDRIQFQIDFPDYNPSELLEIFKKFCSDNKYILDAGGEDEIFSILKEIYVNRDKNFANGRVARKCFDRVKLSQSVRIMNENLIGKEDLMTIKADDIKSLYEDEDIIALMKGNRGHKMVKAIGF